MKFGDRLRSSARSVKVFWNGRPLPVRVVILTALGASGAIPFLSVLLVKPGAIPFKEPPKTIDQAFWNSWVAELGGADPVTSVTPNRSYEVDFDLAALNYQERTDDWVTGTRIDPAFRDALGEAKGSTFPIVVKPVLLGRGLRFLPGRADARTLDVRLDRLREPPKDFTPRGSLSDLSQRVGALHVTVGVEATELGCAAVALSVWNAALRRPLDYVVHTIAVGDPKSPDVRACEPVRTKPQAETGQRLSLLATSNGTVADAALHVFDIKVGGSDSVSTAVYLGHGREAEMISWRPSRSLADFTNLPGFLNDLSRARVDRSYAEPSRDLTAVLFPTETDYKGDAPADVAMRDLRGLLAHRPSANVFVRLVDVEGQSFFLPLGLLDVGGQVLARSAAILQPLPREEAPEPGRCVGPWKMVLPDDLGTGFVEKRFLTPVGAPPEGSTSSFDDLRDYLRGQPSQAGAGEGFLLLAHHGAGFVKFSPSSSKTLLAEDVQRRFPRGSVAVLVACAAGQLSGENRRLPLLTRLTDHQIETAILSPFPVDGPFGARFAHHFAHSVDKARRNHEGPDLRELFRQAAQAVRDEGFVFADQAYEFVLAGNADIRLCK